MMKPKAIAKIITDILMTFGLLFAMGYQFWGELAHEWIGAGMFVLFIVHHFLNLGWYKNLFRGKYSPVRVFTAVIDLLVLADMLALMYSGIVMSRHVFDFLHIHGGMALARRLHLLGSYWGIILMSMHIGLHWNMVLGMAGKAIKINKTSKLRAVILFVLGLCIALYGVIVLIRRDFAAYLFQQTEFVFLDYSENTGLFYLDYLALMGTFIFVSHYLSKLLRNIRPRKENERI